MTFRNCNPQHNEIIGLLFKEYEEFHLPEDATIKAAYNELDKAMDGMTLEQKDSILYPVSLLCTNHERIAFCDGVRIGLRLALDLGLESTLDVFTKN